MANDKLEDFILNNQASFNGEAPAPDLWDRITGELDEVDDEPDGIEAFVATHRDAFDDATPPPRLEGKLFPAESGATPAPPLRVAHSRRRLLPILGLAASVLVLIVAAFLIGNSRGYQTAESDRIAAELERINPEFVEAERFYRGEIASQFTKVMQVNNDPQFVADLEEMDRATQDIRASLLEVPESQRPELVEELIRIYRTKLDILLRVQRQLPPNGRTPRAAPDNHENNHEL